MKQTVLAVMTHLGNEGWNARLQTRVEQDTIDRKRRAEEAWQAEVQARRRAEEEQKNREIDTRFGLGFVLVFVIGGVGAALIYRLQHAKTKWCRCVLQLPLLVLNRQE